MRDAILKEWAKWKGTPFARLQATPQGGVDCANLAVVLLRATGADLSKLNAPAFGMTRSRSIRGGYTQIIEESELFRKLDDSEKTQAGDVLIFKIGARETEHVGLALDEVTMAHAHPQTRADEADLRQPIWSAKLKARYRYNA